MSAAVSSQLPISSLRCPAAKPERYTRVASYRRDRPLADRGSGAFAGNAIERDPAVDNARGHLLDGFLSGTRRLYTGVACTLYTREGQRGGGGFDSGGWVMAAPISPVQPPSRTPSPWRRPLRRALQLFPSSQPLPPHLSLLHRLPPRPFALCRITLNLNLSLSSRDISESRHSLC